jgi:nesprin-1
VKDHRRELDGTQLEAHRGSDFPSVLKDLSDITGEIEAHITRLRHLLLLQQQYDAHISDITNFISKYRDVVKEIEKSGGSLENKIKEFDGVIGKLGECEAQVVSAGEKGKRISEELTIEDRNAITENLNTLNQQLHSLRADTFRLRSENELTAAEFLTLAKDLEAAINSLHSREAEVKSRPTLTLLSEDEDVFTRHAHLTDECKKELIVLNSILDGLKEDEALPPSLTEKVNEARLLNRIFPEELSLRFRYLEKNRALREQLNLSFQHLMKWVEEAESRLKSPESGIDFESIPRDLEDHKKYFSSQKTVDEEVLDMQKVADKVLASLATQEQEGLRTKVKDVSSLVKRTTENAKTRQAYLEQNIGLWEKYMDLLELIRTAISDAERPLEPATSLVALKSNTIAFRAALEKLKVN